MSVMTADDALLKSWLCFKQKSVKYADVWQLRHVTLLDSVLLIQPDPRRGCTAGEVGHRVGDAEELVWNCMPEGLDHLPKSPLCLLPQR